ncbi:MAG: hypothetical protein K2Q12_11320 [Rickettsiales bacterium]|nr:hypothetical protein [Rickettsiales bacterium]
MINVPNGTIGPRTPAVTTTPRRPSKEATKAVERDELLPPTRRGFQNIPADDVLASLIHRALTAIRHGVFWDRGSILNLVV